MAATESADGTTQMADAKVRLRVAIYDALAKSKGYAKVEHQATWHGLARSTMFRLRGGEEPSAETAMRMAADLGVAVEAIWERVAA